MYQKELEKKSKRKWSKSALESLLTFAIWIVCVL